LVERRWWKMDEAVVEIFWNLDLPSALGRYYILAFKYSSG